jgi:hypothetical protein
MRKRPTERKHQRTASDPTHDEARRQHAALKRALELQRRVARLSRQLQRQVDVSNEELTALGIWIQARAAGASGAV